MDFALTDKLRLYGRNNQINNNQTGFSIGVLPGPPWGLVEGFYSSHSTTPMTPRMNPAGTPVQNHSFAGSGPGRAEGCCCGSTSESVGRVRPMIG